MRHSSQSITIPFYITDNVDGGPDARDTLYHNSLMPTANLEAYRTISSISVSFNIQDRIGVKVLDIAIYSNTTYTLPLVPTQTDQEPLVRAIYIVPERDITIKSAAINNTSWFNQQRIISSSVVFTTYDYTSGLNAEGTIGTLYPPTPPNILNPFIGSTSRDTLRDELQITIDRNIAVTGVDLVASFPLLNVPLNDDGTPAKPGKQVIIR